MRETIDRALKTLREYFAKMSRGARIRMAILAGGIIVLAIVVVALLSQTVWVELTFNANVIDDVQAVLGANNVQSRRDGFVIEVPEQDYNRAMEALYEAELIGTPGFDDNYLEAASGFSVSAEHAQQLYDSNTAKRITTMIRQNPKVANAFVIVHSGESSPFRIQTNTRKPTANVQVVLQEGEVLTNTEAQAIANMVRASVPGIEYEDISITDSNLTTYKVGDEAEEVEIEFEQRVAYQDMLVQQAKEQLEELLFPMYGMDNIQVSPFVRLNFDRISETQVEFAPPVPGNEEGMMRTMEEIRERTRNFAAAEGIPGTDENNMGTAQYPWGSFDQDDVYMRDVLRINYDLNETRRAIEVARGQIEDFGVSILVNTTWMGEDIEDAPQFNEELRQLAVNALGIAPNRVTVEHLPFNHLNETFNALEEMAAEREARERMDRLIDQILMYGTILALAIMVILLVRSVLRALRPPPEPELVMAAEGPPLAGIDLIIDEEESEEEVEATVEREYEEIDLNVTKSAGLEQIERFIDKDAAAVAQLLRNWLSEDI